MSKKIFLVGLPASGKTTFAKRLSEQINSTFLDLDAEIVKSTNQSITELFEKGGEPSFREVEKEVLTKVVKDHSQFVLATGGGTPCFFDNMDFMNRNGITIYINTPLEEITRRLADDSSRPLMKKFEPAELLSKRRKWYEQAQYTVSDYKKLEKLFD
ncbi:MAG: shikimate kinase [Cyclobacteriaceae bacterium]